LLGTMRPAKVIAKAFSAGFHRIAHRVRPFPVGSSKRVTRYRRAFAMAWPRGGMSAGLPSDAVAVPAWLCLKYRAVGCRSK